MQRVVVGLRRRLDVPLRRPLHHVRLTRQSGDAAESPYQQAIELLGRTRIRLETAAALYVSPRTVEWHLRKIFAKLGVTTRRRQLRRPAH